MRALLSLASESNLSVLSEPFGDTRKAAEFGAAGTDVWVSER